MRTLKSITVSTLLPIFCLLLFTQCQKEGIADIKPTAIISRSCATISSSWIDQLKSIGATEFSLNPSLIEINAIELTTPTTYHYYASNEILGITINNPDAFLFLITHDGYEGNIVGYYDQNLDLCSSASLFKVIEGDVEAVVYSSLGILGVDSDSF